MEKMTRDAFYRYDPDANTFAGLKLQEGDYDITNLHSKFERLSETWTPIVLEVLEESPSELGDFPTLVDRRRIPIFSERAWTIFESHFRGVAEALPVNTTTGTRLLIIHIFKPVTALVEDRCVFDRFSDGGVRRVNQFCFNWAAIGSELVIKLPPTLGGDLLVSEQFRKITEQKRLRGLNFVEVTQHD